MKNYLKESLLSILCLIIYGKGSSEKALILNCETEISLIAGRIVVLACTHAIEIGRGFFLAFNSKQFVSFNKFYAGKGFCEIFVQMNAQKYKCFSETFFVI